MISWHDALREVEKNFKVIETEPKPDYVWYAYKEGECLGFSRVSREDAETRFNTKFVEKATTNKSDIDAWKTQCRNIETLANDLWFERLLEYYKDLPMKVFHICYNEAYDRYHHAGRDAVFRGMESVVEFAEKILEAKV